MEQLASLTNLISIVAGVIIFLYWIHVFVILYHLIRFGVGTRPKQVSVLFLAGSIGLFTLLILTTVSVVLIS